MPCQITIPRVRFLGFFRLLFCLRFRFVPSVAGACSCADCSEVEIHRKVQRGHRLQFPHCAHTRRMSKAAKLFFTPRAPAATDEAVARLAGFLTRARARRPSVGAPPSSGVVVRVALEKRMAYYCVLRCCVCTTTRTHADGPTAKRERTHSPHPTYRASNRFLHTYIHTHNHATHAHTHAHSHTLHVHVQVRRVLFNRGVGV